MDDRPWVVFENKEDSAFRMLDAGNSLKVTEKIGKDDFEAHAPKTVAEIQRLMGRRRRNG